MNIQTEEYIAAKAREVFKFLPQNRDEVSAGKIAWQLGMSDWLYRRCARTLILWGVATQRSVNGRWFIRMTESAE